MYATHKALIKPENQAIEISISCFVMSGTDHWYFHGKKFD